MIGELSILNEWIPEQMEPGTVFGVGECGEGGRKGRPLLGGALLPFVRHLGADYAQADGGTAAGDLRLGPLLDAVLYSRRRDFTAEAVLEAVASVASSQESVNGAGDIHPSQA